MTKKNDKKIGEGKLILFVDDKEEHRKGFAKNVSEHFGCEVLTADSVAEVNAIVKRLCSEGRRPDLLVTDSMLDDYRVGVDIAEAFKENRHTVLGDTSQMPIVMHTGWPDQNDLQFINAHADVHLMSMAGVHCDPKDYLCEDWLKIIEDLLNGVDHNKIRDNQTEIHEAETKRRNHLYEQTDPWGGQDNDAAYIRRLQEAERNRNKGKGHSK